MEMQTSKLLNRLNDRWKRKDRNKIWKIPYESNDFNELNKIILNDKRSSEFVENEFVNFASDFSNFVFRPTNNHKKAAHFVVYIQMSEVVYAKWISILSEWEERTQNVHKYFTIFILIY